MGCLPHELRAGPADGNSFRQEERKETGEESQRSLDFARDDKSIGLQGFEPWTSPTRTARSTKLSHNPNKTDRNCDPSREGGSPYNLPCPGRVASSTNAIRGLALF